MKLFLHLNFRIIKLKFKLDLEPEPETKVTAPAPKPWFCGNPRSEDICPERKLASPPPFPVGWMVNLDPFIW